MKYLLTLFVVFLFPTVTNAATYTTQQSGNWTAASSWIGNNKPGNWFGAGDVVIVNHPITLNQNINFQGQLIINPGGSLIGSRDIQMNGSASLVNDGDVAIRNLNLNSNSRLINNASFSTSGNTQLNNNADLISNGTINFGGNVSNYGDTLLVSNPATISGNLQNGGVLVASDSLTTIGNITNNGGDIVSSTYLSTTGDITNNSTGTITNNGYLDVGSDFTNNSNASPGFISNGDVIISRDFTNNGSGEVVFNSGTSLNVGNDFTNNNDATLNGNVYVDNNITNNGGSSLSIGSNSIVEVNNSLTNNSNITLDGGLVVGSGGVNNGGGNMDGSGLFQVDGGLTNWGTIGGSLDVCSSDASTNPITNGNNVTGSATICSNGGANFPIVPAAPLPVELASFEAKANGNTVELIWVTLSELNNDYFTIERSKEGVTFIELDYVEGQGTTNERTVYNYTDVNPHDGKSFYRLKQTDFDGRSESFEIVSVLLKSDAEIDVSLYPNPTNGRDVIYLKVPQNNDSEFNVLINDLLGKEFVSDLTFINQGKHTLVIIDFSDSLPRGTYLINVWIEGKMISKKLLVQ